MKEFRIQNIWLNLSKSFKKLQGGVKTFKKVSLIIWMAPKSISGLRCWPARRRRSRRGREGRGPWRRCTRARWCTGLERGWTGPGFDPRTTQIRDESIFLRIPSTAFLWNNPFVPEIGLESKEPSLIRGQLGCLEPIAMG